MDGGGGGGGGGGHTHNEERGAEKMMDDYLKSLGLHRKKIAKDGSCLFRAVAEQVLHCQSLHAKVRASCVEFLKQNRDSYEAFIEGNFEDYLFKLQDPQQWVGEVEISALAVMYKRDFLIYQEPGKPPVNITDNNFEDKVQLCFLNGNHYDSVYPISRVKSAALCQSILYEVLYNGVFKVDRSSLGVCQRVGRPNDLLSDDSMAACASSDESDVDAGDSRWVENETSTLSSSSARHNNQSHRGRGRGRQLSERVRRSLNPTLFRNIDYDVWHKTKRAQQKMDYCIAAGMHYTVGDRCQVRLEGSGRSFSATIKEVPPNNNNRVVVYIEELGKRNVPLWNLRPPGDESSWSTVGSKDKRISNGHGDWEERGKGRGRGKPVPPSSLVSPATAPDSGWRAQKQHSWPPHAAVEEQGGAKPGRKPMSAAESALFGLTEEQRLAKEEEERNVALVEIQLRDENSFPALGTGMQGDGGKKKGGEKRRSQRNKTKSPVEEVRASPPAGETPKSSTPPPAAATAPTVDTVMPTEPPCPASEPAAAPSDSDPARPGPVKAPMPKANVAATASGSAPGLTPTCAAPATKTNTLSYASAAGAAPSSPPPPPAPAAAPAAALNTKPSATGGAPPHSVPSSATVFLTPVLPAASSPPTPRAALPSSSPPPSTSSKLRTSSPSSLPPKSCATPPPSSSVPVPTFIAPIAPSPVAAQGFLPPSSVHRSSPPVTSLPRAPSPPSSTPSSLIHHAAPVPEASPAPGQTPSSLPNSRGSEMAPRTLQSQTPLAQTHPQVSLPQTQTQISVSQTQGDLHTQPPLPKIQAQSQASLPKSQTTIPQTQIEAQSCPPPHQHQPQSLTEVALSLPHDQTQASLPRTQSQAQCPLQHQTEMVQVQSSQPPPGASYPHTSVPAPVEPQPSVTHAQPPHPSQLPHTPLSPSPTQASPQTQAPDAQSQTEAPPLQPQPQPESRAWPPSQPSHLPHPPHQPQSLSAHPPPPPHPQSIPGAVPLQNLSQLYQDPLYPGFPQGEKGDMAPTPLYSSSKSGDDLPQDVNILRFFFNLGIKAYSMPFFPPYMYLLPLQQASTMHHTCKVPSRSPSPTPQFPPSGAPTVHQEAYPQYPPTSASTLPQYDHQAPVAEPPRPGEPVFNQARYPVTQPPPHRMASPSLSWQPHQMPPPRNSSYTFGFPPPNPPYAVPPPSSKGYNPGQGPGHPLYPPAMSPYPPSSLGYQSSPAPEELQVSQGTMEQLQPTNGDAMSGHRPGRVTVPLEGPAAAVANANNGRTVVVSGVNSFAPKEPGEGLTRAVLLVDPPINNRPILALVSNSDVTDAPVSMTTIKPSTTPGSPSPHGIISQAPVPGDHIYWVHQRPFNPNKTYVKAGAPEPGKGGFPPSVPTAEALSVGCSTEDDWDDAEGFKPPLNLRSLRRHHRGGGRGRGPPRRRGGEPGAGFSYSQFGPSHRGQRWL